MSNSKKNIPSSFPVRHLEKIGGPEIQISGDLLLSTSDNGLSEVILDYGRAEGGVPFLETSQVESNGFSVTIEVIYSETSSGVEKDTGMTIYHYLCVKLTFYRRWPFLSLFECHGHLPSQHTHLRALNRQAIHRITIRAKVPEISETYSENPKLLHSTFLNWIPSHQTTASCKEFLQVLK